jgi:hypothetical protein
MTVSQRLIAGDTLSFTTPAPTGEGGVVYRPGDGWSLAYRLVLRGTATAISLTATAEDDDTFRIAVAAATTASWTPGLYDAAAWVTLGADTYTVEPAFAEAQILPNPRTATNFDGRTVAQKALDDLLAARAAYAASNGNVAEYMIGERRMKFRTIAEIDGEITFWRTRRAAEMRAAAVAAGLADPRRAVVSFVRG